jgi:hypothetical protein
LQRHSLTQMLPLPQPPLPPLLLLPLLILLTVY